jgi:hypothetical protein
MIFVVVVITSNEKVRIISIPKGPVYWDKLGNDTSTQILVKLTLIAILT